MFESWVEEYFHFIGYHSCPPVIHRNCLGVMEIFNAQKQSAYAKSTHTKCRDTIRSNHMQFRYLRYRFASSNILPPIKRPISDSLFDLRNEMLLEETRRSTLIGGGYYPIMFSISKDETVSIKFQMEQSNCQMALSGTRIQMTRGSALSTNYCPKTTSSKFCQSRCIPNICHFWYATALSRLVKSTPKSV